MWTRSIFLDAVKFHEEVQKMGVSSVGRNQNEADPLERWHGGGAFLVQQVPTAGCPLCAAHFFDCQRTGGPALFLVHFCFEEMYAVL